jgi:Cu-Zn family superoxide dismutase
MLYRLLTMALSLTLCVELAFAQKSPQARTSALIGANGQVIGRVTVTTAPNGVILRVQAKGLTPGWHGMHLHEKADCNGPAFKGAGGHIHIGTPAVHGMLNTDFNDAGDLPNLYVSADGLGSAELYSTLVTLNRSDARPALLDADGSALVIHANPDDHKSQPIGGTGERIACASIH